MSKTWYPIIDYGKCTGCLACYEKCTHGVYELSSKQLPKVIFPEGCIQNCTGCGELCSTNAITYLGDTISLGASCCESDEKSCCGGSNNDRSCCSDVFVKGKSQPNSNDKNCDCKGGYD